MKKRIAFLGLSYPLMFDSTRVSKSWLASCSDDTLVCGHPVIGSGNGLIIMFDEIWFLTKALCPINMQRYPFVKYVDEMNLPIEFSKIIATVDSCNKEDANTERPVSEMPISTQEIQHQLKLPNSVTGYTEFTPLSVCNFQFIAGPSRRNYMIDYLIVTELQRLTKNYYELVSNINIPLTTDSDATNTVDLVGELLIDNIPDIIEKYGPFSPDIWSLRENSYLKDFRKWIIENHSHVQKSEIKEIKESVQSQIDTYRNEVFLKEAEKSLFKNTFFSVAKNAFNTSVEAIPNVGMIYSMGKAAYDTTKIITDSWKFKSNRWMAFMVSAETINNKKRD